MVGMRYQKVRIINSLMKEEDVFTMNLEVGSAVITTKGHGFVVVEDDGFYRVMNSDFQLWERRYDTLEEMKEAILSYYDIAQVIPAKFVNLTYYCPGETKEIKSFE